MSEATIADANIALFDLQKVLDDAYWESSSIERKDAIYSIIALIQGELSEIAKLSIQDHDLPYEPISTGFSDIKSKLNQLRKVMDEFVMRSKTARELEGSIAKVVALTD